MRFDDTDILKTASELKKMPYSVPEGYFDALKKELAQIPARQEKPVTIRSRLMPVLAMAASFAALICLGTYLLRGGISETELTQEDYIVFSDNYINTALYEETEDVQIADAGLADEDIIEYLIYTGVSPEMIELSK